MLLVFTVIARHRLPARWSPRSPRSPACKSRADGSLIKQRRQGRRLEADRAELHRQQGQSAAAVLPARPSAAGARLRPDRDQRQQPRPGVDRRHPARPVGQGRHRQAEPAHPGLHPQPRDRPARRRRRLPARSAPPDGVGAVLAVFWSGPGYHGHRHPGGQPQPDRTGHTVPRRRTRASRSNWPSSAQDYSKGQVVPIRGNAPAQPGRAGRRGHRVRLRPRPGDQPGLREDPGSHASPRPAASPWPRSTALVAEVHGRPRPRLHRRAAGQRAAAQPRPRPAAIR